MNKSIIQSDHYSFHVSKGSLAYTDIDRIVSVQEDAYHKITNKLDVVSQLHIKYHLVKSPIYCGRAFNTFLVNVGCDRIESYKTNAFAWYPDIVYATYNKTIKAIGCHEDTHLIAYEYFKQLASRFFTEGLAVSFDEYWIGVPVHECAKPIVLRNINTIFELLANEVFDSTDCLLAYPVAGSFCLWFSQKYGMNEMKKVYRESLHNPKYVIEKYKCDEYIEFIEDLSLS